MISDVDPTSTSPSQRRNPKKRDQSTDGGDGVADLAPEDVLPSVSDAYAVSGATKDYHRRMPRKASGHDHRTFYALKVEIGFVVALMFLLGLIRSPMYTGEDTLDITLAEQEVIKIEEIRQTKQDLPPPPPPRPPVPIEVEDDVVLEDEVINLDATLDIDDIVTELPPPPPPKVEVVEEPEPEIFIAVEEMPEMIGGMEALMNEVKYPQLARQAGVEGRVTVQFVVDEEGNVTDPVVLKGIGGGCDEEAVRAVSLMKFKPGRQRGKPVRVQYATSVRFRLKEAKG